MKKVYKDISGYDIFVTVKIMDKEFLIVSLYGPNRDNPEFYVELEERWLVVTLSPVNHTGLHQG